MRASHGLLAMAAASLGPGCGGDASCERGRTRASLRNVGRRREVHGAAPQQGPWARKVSGSPSATALSASLAKRRPPGQETVLGERPAKEAAMNKQRSRWIPPAAAAIIAAAVTASAVAPAMASDTNGTWATCTAKPHDSRPSGLMPGAVVVDFSCSRIAPDGQVRGVLQWSDGTRNYTPWYGARQTNVPWVSGLYHYYAWDNRVVTDTWVEQGPMQFDVPRTQIPLGDTPGRLTATLPSDATGTVTFFDSSEQAGPYPMGSAPIVGGVAVFDPAPFKYAGLNRLWAYWQDSVGVKHFGGPVDVQVR